MARIKTFKAIRPNPLLADTLVATAPQTESIVLKGEGEEAIVLKTVLESVARHRPETVEGQAGAYREILATLQDLQKQGVLLEDLAPCLYIYEVVHAGGTQTGVWALTDLQDYLDGRIKIHELTFGDSVRRLHNYREATGLEGSPILLTYEPDAKIDALIKNIKTQGQYFSLGNQHGLHRLWKVDDARVQQQLIDAFTAVKTVYLADGHHRIASAAKLMQEQAVKGIRPNSSLSSLYMATDQLQISPFHRAVIPEQTIDKLSFFGQLGKSFYVQEAWGNHAVLPQQSHRLGMLLDKQWYHLTVKLTARGESNVADDLDVTILQERVLRPLFGISDPKTDTRLKCIGGENALEQLLEFESGRPESLIFTLCPINTGELLAVANAGEILPPKSTWINPKVPYGLLLYQFH